MNTNQELLIRALLDASFPISATTLSRAIGVSVRTIKNYVDDINRSNKDEKIILSFPNGYAINKSLGFQLINEKPDLTPQNYQDRSHYIIKRLLLDHDSNLDVFELSDDLFVSDSTLKNDILKMNSTFSTFDITFKVINNKLSLSGDEKSKRKLVSYVLSLETQGNFMNVDILKKTFDEEQIETIARTVNEVVSSYNYYLNDFTLMNFVLHLTIIINRIRNGKTISKTTDSTMIKQTHTIEAVLTLSHALEKHFDLEFNNLEIQDIDILFSTAASFSNISFNCFKDKIDSNILNLTHIIINNVKTNYFIDLENESFMFPFALHLQKLVKRITLKSFTPNPMVDTIKNSCPLIYDIAVSISLQIEKEYDYLIPESEITFIALHLGSEIEQQELNKQKIRTVVICPDYGKLRDSLFNSLQKEFGEHLNILHVNQNQAFETYFDFDFDLMITTSDVPYCDTYQSIKVSPFLTEADKTLIYSAINSIRYSNKNNVLKDQFDNHFSSDVFFVNPSIDNKYEAIHLLSSKMLSLGFVDELFEKQVLERERAGSTAFINIAIPHSVKAESFKTSIGVIVMKEGLNWDEKIVKIIYLIALNEVDKKVFSEMYEALVLLSSKETAIKLISECTSFDDFRDVIMLLISNEQHKI